MRDDALASARRSAPTDAATHRDNRGICSKLSRLPRFGNVVEQTCRNAPFIVASTCQSGIKRTLRYSRSPPVTVCSRAFRRSQYRAFGANGERRVSRTDRVWFRNGGCPPAHPALAESHHQSKIYTES